jgi:hypothetical protein
MPPSQQVRWITHKDSMEVKVERGLSDPSGEFIRSQQLIERTQRELFQSQEKLRQAQRALENEELQSAGFQVRSESERKDLQSKLEQCEAANSVLLEEAATCSTALDQWNAKGTTIAQDSKQEAEDIYRWDSTLFEIGEASIDPKTGATLGLTDIDVIGQVRATISLPDGQSCMRVTAVGQSWAFAHQGKKYRLLLTKASYKYKNGTVSVLELPSDDDSPLPAPCK